jgi:hypothetical protein
MLLPPKDIQTTIYRSFTSLIDEIQKPIFSFDEFVTCAVIWRDQKEVRMEYDKMPADMAGYGVGLPDCFFIGISKRLSPTQQLVTKLHELWHIRRKDIPDLSDKNAPPFREFIRRRDRLSFVVSRQMRTSTNRFFIYNEPSEYIVEALARMTMERILKYEASNNSIVII